MALILGLGELRQENHEFEDILGYMVKRSEGKGIERKGRTKKEKGKVKERKEGWEKRERKEGKQ